MVTYKKVTNKEELQQILNLQEQNLPGNLTLFQRTNQGFVTVKHNLDLLAKMNETCPHSVAIFKDKVVGYALSMTRNFDNEIEVLKPMFNRLTKIRPTSNYIVMGQICIDKDFRKQGIFRGLYNYMKNEVCSNVFDEIITEIDNINTRSLNAHFSVGFKELVTYKSNGQDWIIVTLKV